MAKNLVIVESPAKAKTLSKMLGRNYELKASMGHVRDLPKSQLGVDIEHDFTPKYVVSRDKSKLVKELKEAAKDAKIIYLATDPDREGEAISWHLKEVTSKDGQNYKRVVFHEITKEAIDEAFKHPRDIDMHLVDAQQARRILDRLVGYKLSPLLWRKIRRGLSAGRVQSVALKIVVDREREILKFKPVEYWSIEAELAKKPAAASDKPFRSTFVGLAGGKKVEIRNKEEADDFEKALRKADYSVLKVATKKVTRQPSPPFITSTLQQEAWRKLHMTARQTMAVAQQLYEGLSVGKEGNIGLITYMRTDSTNVAQQALTETREYIAAKYGKDYIPAHARTFVGKVKGAQEAHEAIRPTSTKREPALLKEYLSQPQYRVYDLIWKRMVASQMAAVVFDSTTIDVKAKSRDSKTEYLFRTTNSVLDFPGFTALYIEGKDEEEENGKKASPLPTLTANDPLSLIDLFPEQHFTQPPARYTEATLVKMLESEGIGRPSTYATIISTIQEREYVEKEKGALKPTELGFTVNDMVAKNFPDIVDIKFTAKMEDGLDEVAEDGREWEDVVKEFYGPFGKSLATAEASIEKIVTPVEVTDEKCPLCSKPLVIKSGRFGRFLACSGYPECKFTKSFQATTGVPCPEPGCGGEILILRSKGGRTFYGCSNYKKCVFKPLNNRPVKQKCPECGWLMTVYGKDGKKAKCIKCGHIAPIEEIIEVKVA